MLARELADVLAVYEGTLIDSSEPFSMAFRAVALWAELSRDSATCELIEFAPMLGVLIDGITVLTTPGGVRLWLRPAQARLLKP